MKVMLAAQYNAAKVEEQLPMFGQPKLDGIRMFVKDGVAYSRSLKPIRSEQVQEMVRQNAEILEGLDGEIIAGSPTADDVYRRTSSSIMSYGKFDDVKFHIFDIMDEDLTYSERKDKLHDPVFRTSLPSWCELVETMSLFSIEGIEAYSERKEKQGYEGIILRNPESYYKMGRATAKVGELIKVKKFLDTEAVIIGFEELLHNENEAEINHLGYTERSSHKENMVPAGMLGAIKAVGKYDNGESYEVSIGSGFDHKTRQDIWENRDEYLGKFIKFKYFPVGIKKSPRFPIFLGIRDRTDMDEIPEGEAQKDLFSM